MPSKLFFITTIICMLCMSPFLTFERSIDQTYIVQVEEPNGAQLKTLNPEALQSYYSSFLSVATAKTSTNDLNSVQDLRIIHSFRYVFAGFAAKLSANDFKDLEMKKGFIAAWPERILSLHTTHSPSFLGLNQNVGLWSSCNQGNGIIIGMLDTGISPDHPSFSDNGMQTPPPEWKRKYCQLTNFRCNNKIIGARSFVSKHNKTALDDHGHGTHTSSTAAGNFVKGANIFENANGTASGIAPRAHLAIYKVCNATGGCPDSAVISGMDAAIEDGVDVISISFGLDELSDYFHNDPLAISAFSAMEKGIFVSFAVGNDGPDFSSVINGVPWALSVGASTMDREIRATVVLENNQQLNGQSAFQPKDFPSKFLPLVYDKDCSAHSLKGTRIRGKMVVCEYEYVDLEEILVKSAHGAAMILVNFEKWANTTFSNAYVLPTSHVGYADGLKIKHYINSTTKPTAKILFKGTMIGDKRAPVVAAFSSRGPNPQSPGILKPDILGPGVNILAAWPTSVENIRANTKSTFNMISGTSMSCPHLSGVAALLKRAHPDWSPAAIKSAIMTTANVVNRANNPIEDETFLPADIFATGAGHVNPAAANDPGLIYDIKSQDYIPYLCGLKYTDKQVQSIVKKKVECSKLTSIPEAQLNYPSFALTFTGQPTASQTYTRTVTNVGDPYSSYDLDIITPTGIKVVVQPRTLNFSKLKQKLQYNVTFLRLASAPINTTVHGFLKWCSFNSKYQVRIPIGVILQ